MIKESLRGEYGKSLVRIGKINPDIVVLDADLAKSTRTMTFAVEFPDRFFDSGLSEQDMISTGAGIALTGKTVFVSSFAIFLTGRAYGQVRQSVCYNNANVKLVATHSGLGVGEDGATHQALEDIALMRTLPNMRLIVPADSTETASVIDYITKNYGPFYVRLTRSDLMKVHDDNYTFRMGKGEILKDGEDITIIAIGAMIENAIKASEELSALSISAAVINMSSIKPIDSELILKYAKKTGAILTVEDHSVYSGLGGAVAEVVSQNHPVKMKLMGVQNRFGRSGKPEQLYKFYSLDHSDIVNEVKTLLKK